MDRHMIVYRGSLKSCNYQCSYCPFSKHRASERELAKDKEQWLHFVRTFEERAEELHMHALMVAPYGEALIHSWYWEGLARLSALPQTDAAGAQTNLSFSVKKALKDYIREDGIQEKLRLWATFHPEMTSAADFAEKCRQIRSEGISICAGAVGVPENLPLIRLLRKELPEEIYLWVNRMDGMRRAYTPEERNAFLEIDPYFERELLPMPADVTKCHGRLFAEGDGRLHICNISPAMEYKWDEWEHTSRLHPVSFSECRRKLCSCYLAYGGRKDFMNQILFGPYPLFRIPRRPKAVFLDIEGTLIPETDFRGERAGLSKAEIPEDVLAGLKGLLQEKSILLFATTLPYEDAVKRCGRAGRLFSGGIFSGGAHLLLVQNGTKREFFYFLEESVLSGLEEGKERFHYRMIVYRRNGRAYKVTLLRPSQMPWDRREAEELTAALPAFRENGTRYFIEDHCLQIAASEAAKENGVRTLCRWLGISPEETAAAGNSPEDEGMLKLCGMR